MFRIGLFSSLDVILRRPLEGVLKELSLEEDPANALLGRCARQDPVLRLYQLVLAHERGDWRASLGAQPNG